MALASLASPFQRVPGTFKFGDYTYEWRSLLETPCYGFNGPNACLDPTCKHDGGARFKKEQSKGQQFKQKSSTSKFLLKFNVRAISGDSDSKSSSGQEHMVYSGVNGGHFNFDGRSMQGQSIQQFFTVSPTIEVNFHVESPSTVHYSSSLSSLSTPNGYTSSDSNSSSSSSSKIYAFNPLSKPFHPMKKSSQKVPTGSDIVSCAPAKTTTTKGVASAAAPVKTSPPKIDEIDDVTFSKIICRPSKYVCILCPKTFSTATELQQHIENKAKRPHGCVICGLTFTHGYQLQRHLWIHLKNHRRIRSFNCRACHKKFRSLNQLHKHYELCQYKLYIFF